MEKDKVESRTAVTIRDCVCDFLDAEEAVCSRKDCPCPYCWCNYGLCGCGQPPRDRFIDVAAPRPSVPQQGQALDLNTFADEWFARNNPNQDSTSLIYWAKLFAAAALAASRSEEATPPQLSREIGNVLDHWEQLPSDLRSDSEFKPLNDALKKMYKVRTGAPAAGSTERSVVIVTSGKTFEAEGYVTGDHEAFCIADAQEPSQQKKRVYPDEWFEDFAPDKQYQFFITVSGRALAGTDTDVAKEK